MTPDTKPGKRRLAAAIVALFCLPLGGCGMILDEFTWLDRPPPKTDVGAGAAGEPVPAALLVGR